MKQPPEVQPETMASILSVETRLGLAECQLKQAERRAHEREVALRQLEKENADLKARLQALEGKQ